MEPGRNAVSNIYWENISVKDLRIGDTVYLWSKGDRRVITDIKPYKGPYKDQCVGLLEFNVGVGMSIWRDQTIDVLRIKGSHHA